MRRQLTLVSCCALGCAPLAAQQAAPRHAAAYASAPDIPFDTVPDFLKLPDGLYLGEGMGVARNSENHIFVYTRSGQASRLFEFDENGAFVREIGRGLYGFVRAHAVRVDPEDNIWAVDEGADMVIKFNPQGRVSMLLGRRVDSAEAPRRGESPPPEPAVPYRLERPTDVAWDADGNIFVADGYTNSRVVKYDRNGRFVKDIGERGAAPNQFNVPHSIQVDPRGNVYVADRDNSRIQVYNNDLELQDTYDDIGRPWALCITRGAHPYLYSSNSNPDDNDSAQMAVTGEIYKMELDGTVVGKFGEPGKQWGQFGTVNAIDCRDENELLVSEITTWRVQKLILHP